MRAEQSSLQLARSLPKTCRNESGNLVQKSVFLPGHRKLSLQISEQGNTNVMTHGASGQQMIEENPASMSAHFDNVVIVQISCYIDMQKV